MSTISIDTECCGLDHYHGSNVYRIVTCDTEGQQYYWPSKDARVDPVTRQFRFSKSDLAEFKDYALSHDKLWFANPVYDVTGLYHAGCDWIIDEWHRARDVGLAAHLVCSADKRKDLTTLTLKYLGIDIGPYEDRVKAAVRKAHNIIRRNKELDHWRIIRRKDNKIVYDPMMPSNKGENAWKADMWILPVLADYLKYDKDHPWYTLELDYALADPAVTLPLGQKLEKIIREKGLWKIYQARTKLLKINHEMQFKGVTLNGGKVNDLIKQYTNESDKLGKKLVYYAKSCGLELTLPKSGNNGQLVEFVFGEAGLNLKPVSFSKKTGQPELNKKVIETYLAELPPQSKGFKVIKALGAKRSRDTAAKTYLTGYLKHYLPAPHSEHAEKRSCVRAQISSSERFTTYRGDTFLLHPSLNAVGTSTLRWSSSNPNSQNISKKESFNLRSTFGPAPGREWWSLDYNNLELVIPFYESGEEELIRLFEKPNEPPYFGSYHLMIFDVLHPDKWDHSDPEGLLKAKKKYASTWYQFVKNGNFAVIYGAMEESGTADAAYHIPGAQRKISSRFSKLDAHNKRMISFARKHGYVETIPDCTVDPTRGYPVYCDKDERGRIKPTMPLNYRTQSSAMWCTMKAMIRVAAYLEELNLKTWGKTTLQILADPVLSKDPTVGYFLILQVHDEIVLECVESKSMKGLEIFQAILRTAPGWCKDLPLAAECSVDTRYGK